jgi:hypothetical protein
LKANALDEKVKAKVEKAQAEARTEEARIMMMDPSGFEILQ